MKKMTMKNLMTMIAVYVIFGCITKQKLLNIEQYEPNDNLFGKLTFWKPRKTLKTTKMMMMNIFVDDFLIYFVVDCAF